MFVRLDFHQVVFPRPPPLHDLTLPVGDIILMNLKTDIVLFTFKQGHTKSFTKEIVSTGNEVTSISFRTDASAEKFPYMATGSGDGRVYVWHLGCPGQAEEPRRLMLTLDEAHGNYFLDFCS